MARTIDKIALTIVTFLVFFCWISHLTSSAYIGLVCALLISVMLLFSVRIVKNRLEKNKNMSISQVMFLLALMGQNEATALFAKTLPQDKVSGVSSPYILAEIEHKISLIFVNFKYGKTIFEEIAKTYRKAKTMGIGSVIVLSEKTDRNIMIMAAALDINFTFVGKSAIRSYLKKNNALPQTLPKKKYKPVKLDYKELLDNVCSRRKAKYYIFITIIMVILSFFTPLKIYYLVLATIPFCLTVGSFIKSE